MEMSYMHEGVTKEKYILQNSGMEKLVHPLRGGERKGRCIVAESK